MSIITLSPAILTVAPKYTHLLALSDGHGLFEHADGDQPRREHGYCVDDVARGLLIAVREPSQSAELAGLTGLYLHFLASAATPDGRSHNRQDAEGAWTDEPGVGDWWGRSLWALGVAAAIAPMADTRADALETFLGLARERSTEVRAMAFAALGAGELILAGNSDPRVRSLLVDALAAIPTDPLPGWGWPEERLRYANGSLAEAVIIGGMALHDPFLLRRGVVMLDALTRIETHDDHLCITGTTGRGRTDSSPLFDQQPIEVAALADAASRAFDATDDPRFLDTVQQCWAWFLGHNHSGATMVDLATGAGYDGLEVGGRNENRGAESTLAALGTWQQFTKMVRTEGER